MRIILILLLVFPVFSFLNAQDGHHHTHNDHRHSDYHSHKSEIGIAIGPGINISESEWAVAFHFHYLRSFGKNERFSTGPGFEAFLDDHRHLSFLWSLGYRPVHPLYFGISPGFSFEPGHSDHMELEYITHFEVLYEFELENFHFGPMLEYATGKEDSHLVTALHIGWHF